MKTKYLLGILALLLALCLLQGASAWWPGTQQVISTSMPLTSLTQITKVRIHGRAGVVHLATRSDAPFSAQLFTHSAGWGSFWRSAWASGACTDVGTMVVEGSTLKVTMLNRADAWAWWGEPDCTPELQAQLPQGVSVEVDQQASRLVLDGDFATVAIQSSAGDVALRGHASALTLSGSTLRAQVEYTQVQRNETIAFQGQAMDIDLRMPPATPIHYLVEAHASLINSSLPNTTGALPSITVRGDMVRATFR